MKGIDLYEAIGNISDRYIEEADYVKRIISFRRKSLVSMASIVLILVVVTSAYEVTHKGHIEDTSMAETATVTREMSVENSADTPSMISETIIAEVESLVNQVSVQYEGIVYYEQACYEVTDADDISTYGDFTFVEHLGDGGLSIIEGALASGDVYIEEETDLLAIVTNEMIYLFVKES